MITALRGVSLSVPERGIVALLGGNGAGKTTTLKAISGLLRAEQGTCSATRILYQDNPIDTADPWTLVSRGLVQVLEGRRCFVHLSVEDNLRLGAFPTGARRADVERDLERIYTIFPRLRDKRKALTGYASGGEQQMVAIGRALMARPTLVLLDEPSMGLAPKVVEEIFDIIAELNETTGTSFLLAEQNAAIALRYAKYGYALENGRVVAQGSVDELSELDVLHRAYLGGEITRQRLRSRYASLG
ncbi:ABC transporter ATP-binding protein [Pararobbsia silviterrae]|uniref:ABC transporter ATP-binding protein n=2 Tax=Pararobbsia silviterrae TaxID=1792498 RepID=A0A494YC71_9BURK|nr:ABC transporter ATP-binding protein [Pararobbsia silviterrae]RKP59390.1 ABC transporter ATP-binding protein [Pararobbsia silviterrae]